MTLQQWLRSALGVVLLGVFLAGCQSNPPATTEPSQDPVPPVTTPPPAPEPKEPEIPADRVEGGNLYINNRPLTHTFYFEFDKATLSQGDLGRLEPHAAYLRANPSQRVTLEGHCDERGTREYNLALGERRAAAVRDFFVSSGVSRSQINTVSYGEERPEDPGHTDSAWERNRRAIISYR